MPFWQAFYHLVWVTQDRQPWITSEIEAFLYPVISAKCEEKGSIAYAINGMPDHVHLVAAIPPSIAVSDVVKHIKGATSHSIADKFDRPFKWQRGYGMFTVSKRNLDQAIAYVENQKKHHANGTTIASLERASYKDIGPQTP